MSHTPHELAEEFPEHVDAIHRMKTQDAHFARLFDEYHNVNRAVHRAETRLDVMSDQAEEDLRKSRLRLKDELWEMLSAG